MTTKMSSPVERIDNALEDYFSHLNIPTYRDENGLGRFRKFIQEGELEDLSVENELGVGGDPEDCVYAWMNHDTPFPIPPYAQIPHNKRDAFTFYVLQYCYKHSAPPTDKYIQTTVIPKCNGTVHSPFSETTLPSKSDTPPMAFAQNMSLSDIKEETVVEIECDRIDEEIEGRKMETKSKNATITRLSKCEQFQPKYPPRAHLNIFTSKPLTKLLIDVIDESFENDAILYYYTDISSALQMNDRQMKEFKILINGTTERRLSIINYDLHCNRQVLYGIIIPNDSDKIKQHKWLWKLSEFLTAEQIFLKYKIAATELPLSSRKMPLFRKISTQKLTIDESLLNDTDWFKVQQIKSLKRNVKMPKVCVTLTKQGWIRECKKSFRNVSRPLIPIVVNKNNTHWIEWVKIVCIESQNIFVGISCKYDESNNLWTVQSICLDRGDIYNKHRLVGIKMGKYSHQMRDFKTSITEIVFSDNDSKDMNKKMSVLKQQIVSQKDSIVRLNESLLRAKNANKYVSVHDNEQKSMVFEAEKKRYITEFINDTTEEMCDSINSSEAWLDRIVDDVIKTYQVLEFKLSPIGAKRNIYIDKQLTKVWMSRATPKFQTEAMMYYWMDYTIAMQMCQGHSKQYINTANGDQRLMVAIVNFELRDQSNNALYGIILCENERNEKYPFRLQTLMTKAQIRAEYGIHFHDLPAKSRKNKDFMNKLLLPRKVVRQDLHKIGWSNLKLFKCQSAAHNNETANKSVAITQKVMKEYCLVALEKLNVSNKNGNNNNNRSTHLIPILVVDKHQNYYGIEWILIVHIIHRNCDVGISLRYNDKSDVFVATAIYLDKGEIESKHKLIGLKFDYCKYLRPFSLRKFKFKSERQYSMNGNDGNIEQIQNEVIQYKQALQMEQAKVQRLEQTLQIHSQNMYAANRSQYQFGGVASYGANHQFGYTNYGPR